MGGKPTKGQRRIQMLYDSANNDGYVALEWAANDRIENGNTKKGYQKPALQQKTTADDKFII